MLSRLSILGWAAMALLAVGCGKSSDKDAPQAAPAAAVGAEQKVSPQDQDAKLVVTNFLEALRKGDNEAATKLLTKVARQKAAETGRSVAPPANDSARFEVDQPVFPPTPGHDIAHVPTKWIDLDETGKPRTDNATWVCRLEAEGWRVAGFAAYVFEGEDPLLLSFEDPDDMAKKQTWLKEEITRRMKQATAAPASGGNPFQAEKKPQDAFRR